MASSALSDYLEVLLADAEELGSAHTSLRTGARGRQWGLGSLNRAVVVASASAWEAYVEELVIEAIEALRPLGPPAGVWPALNASARNKVGRFNNPNPQNVKMLFAESIGLPNIRSHWVWQSCSSQKATEKLQEALRIRHEIAHGVNPRPVVHNQYASWLPGFFRRLGRCTDRAVRTHMVQVLGVPAPWPE